MNAPKLDAQLINPFIESAMNVFQTAVNLKPVRTGLHLKDPASCSLGDISAILGFAGDLVGNLVLSFPEAVAKDVVSRMIGEMPDWDSPFLREGVAEIANMIVGNAKARFSSQQECRFKFSLPSLITGKRHYVAHPSRMPVVTVEFNLESVGPFALEICGRKSE